MKMSRSVSKKVATAQKALPKGANATPRRSGGPSNSILSLERAGHTGEQAPSPLALAVGGNEQDNRRRYRVSEKVTRNGLAWLNCRDIGAAS
jgi:hypothetical protein